MNRYAKNRDLPHLPPVEKIELRANPSKVRIAAVILLLGVGAAALSYGFSTFLNGEAGWREIEGGSNSGPSISDEFVFYYDVGAGEHSAAAENRTLTTLYQEGLQTGYCLFSADQAFEGVTNLYSLNTQPNTVLEVDPTLYQAFALLERYDDRSIYLAPVYELYDDMFYCQDDAQAAYYDPARNPEMAAYYDRIAEFANDPAMIDVELLGENRLRLNVAPDYARFAQENEIEHYIDFFWLRNAFLIDYLADIMRQNGFTNGTLSSGDGFVRALDERGAEYSLTVLDRVDRTVYPAATMRYMEARSIVTLHNYPTTPQNSERYYTFADGSIFTPYLDAKDARCKSAVNDLLVTSTGIGCAELLLRAIPVYVADELDRTALTALAEDGVTSVFCQDEVLYRYGDSLQLTDLYTDETRQYTAAP